MRYTLARPDCYFQGLPALEIIDDADLDDKQKNILSIGVSSGVYIPIEPEMKKRVKAPEILVAEVVPDLEPFSPVVEPELGEG